MYEPGTYWAKITAQQLSETSKGNPQFVLTFSLQGRVNRADPEGDLVPCPSGERRMYRAITDKTIKYFMDDLRSLGFIGDSFRQLDPKFSGHFSFLGKELEVECEHEMYEGKQKERWQLRFGAAPLDSLADDKVRNLDALFAKQLRSLGNGAAEKPRRAVSPPRDANAAFQEAAAESVTLTQAIKNDIDGVAMGRSAGELPF
ncbi:hypothetical protein [uncultured Mediterranean phage uvDeep-CGR2-KM19-C37]|nr:hypothetical protein [uncultured Mediterranean phage uvDeep-CGR2-KM19-C37]